MLERLDWSKAQLPEARKTWRYMVVENILNQHRIYHAFEYELDKILKNDAEFLKSQEYKDRKDTSLSYLELLNPLQRYIGCGPKPEGDKYVIVCLLGP